MQVSIQRQESDKLKAIFFPEKPTVYESAKAYFVKKAKLSKNQGGSDTTLCQLNEISALANQPKTPQTAADFVPFCSRKKCVELIETVSKEFDKNMVKIKKLRRETMAVTQIQDELKSVKMMLIEEFLSEVDLPLGRVPFGKALKNKFRKMGHAIKMFITACKIRICDRKLARWQARAEKIDARFTMKKKLSTSYIERLAILENEVENWDRFAPDGNEANAQSVMDNSASFMTQEKREREFSFAPSIRRGIDSFE